MALKPKEISFSGRLITADDPANITPNDFQELRNMRYGNKAPHGVGGCTKYNTSPLASTGIRNGIHFRKGNGESHVLVATSDGKIWRNGTAIGSQGNFDSALWSTAGQTTPRFAIAPQGALVAADGVNTLVYGGTEFRCAGFIDYPETSKVYDYSEEITNSLTSSDQLATVHSANAPIDANTMLLLHLDNNVTDVSPTTPHTVTNNNVTFDASNYKFGTHAAVFNGTTAYLTAPDNADFDFSGGAWTIDFWYRSARGTVFCQKTDDNNYMSLTFNSLSIVFSVVAASVEVVHLEILMAYGWGSNWTHCAFVENGDNYYLFLNGDLAATVTDTSRLANYTDVFTIGRLSTGAGSGYLSGRIDEFRISNSARWASSFTPPSGAYGTGYQSTTYIGSILPLSGFKAYVGTANAVAATMAVNEWNGSNWSALTITDNTASGGISLAQTGTVTWASTASTSKPKVIEKNLLYWYQVIITAAATFTATLSQVTVNLGNPQQLKELWDGEPRSLTAFIGVRSGIFYDYTSNVFEDSIDSGNTFTWAAIGQYTASDYLLIGSPQQLMGVIFNLADTAVNTNAVIVSVSYWDGSAWQALVLDDTTKDGTKSLAKSGMIMWTPPTKNAEQKQTGFSSHVNMASVVTTSGNKTTIYPPAGLTFSQQIDLAVTGVKREEGNVPSESRRSSFPAYYYKVAFSATLSGSDANGVKVYYAAGIPAPQTIKGFTFAAEHQESLWLFDNYDGKRNFYMASAPNTVNVFNGKDAFQGELGTANDPPLAAASLITKTGVAISDTLVVVKANETYVINGTNPSEYVQRRLKENIGIVAPQSMVVIPFGDEAVQGIARNVCMWISTQGPVMCDGYSAWIVSHDGSGQCDIADKFNPKHANYIGAAALKASTAFYDPAYDAYVWCIGGSTTWRYDLKRKKWHEVPMSTATRLYGGFSVLDTNGVSHAYGFGNTGYVWYLDNGNTLDGDAIAQSLWTADIVPEGNYISAESFVRSFKLVQKAKANTSNNLTITHFGDSKTSGTTVDTYSPAASGKRLRIGKGTEQQPTSMRLGPHICHSFKMELSTSDEPLGYEPLMAAIKYEVNEVK